MNAEALARAVVHARFPDAEAAVLAAASTSPGRGSTSDLDLVVVRAGGAAAWVGFHTPDAPVEAFVADRDGWDACVAEEVGRRCPIVLHITATGVPLTRNDTTTTLQQRARELLSRGPAPVPAAELALGRRLLHDLAEDLRGGGLSPLELAFVIDAAGRLVAELVLGSRRQWLGTGKWLARRLADADPALAQRLQTALRSAHAGNVRPLVFLGRDVLEATGGPVPSEWQAPPS